MQVWIYLITFESSTRFVIVFVDEEMLIRFPKKWTQKKIKTNAATQTIYGLNYWPSKLETKIKAG